MQSVIKFGVLFVLVSVVLVLFGSSLTVVFDLFGSSLNYVTTGNIYEVMTAIVGFIGWFLDFLFLGTETTYTTTYGSIGVGSLSWVITIARVLFGVTVIVLIFKLLIDKE